MVFHSISNEVRLIYVVQQGTNLPLFFRHVPGNVIDVSTLIRTIAELKAYDINTKFAILDAGYLTQDNLRALHEHKVSFLSRLQENRKDYRELKAEHLESLESKEHLVEYNSRYVYVKRVRATIMGQQAYAYICRDMAMKNIESSNNVLKSSIIVSLSIVTLAGFSNNIETSSIILLVSG